MLSRLLLPLGSSRTYTEDGALSSPDLSLVGFFGDDQGVYYDGAIG